MPAGRCHHLLFRSTTVFETALQPESSAPDATGPEKDGKGPLLKVK